MRSKSWSTAPEPPASHAPSTYICLGVQRKNDHSSRHQRNHLQRPHCRNEPYKERFAGITSLRTLADAANGADVLLGLSTKGAFTAEMIASLAPRPVVFAMANPDPEIAYEEARAVRDDIIMATGRSDYPNQVNNVLGFPSIFRGALDVHATTINEEMKLAATHALAALAKQDVPDSVCRAYGVGTLEFGINYIIPKPFDPRVLVWQRRRSQKQQWAAAWLRTLSTLPTTANNSRSVSEWYTSNANW